MSNQENVFRKYMDEAEFHRIRDYDTVCQMWEASVAQYPEQTAIVDEGTSYTYAQLDAGAARFRGALVKGGVNPGDKVALLAGNSYEFAAAFLGIVTLGCAAFILPVQLDETAVFGCCMLSGAKAILYQPALQAKTAVAAAKGIICIATDTVAYTTLVPPTAQAEDDCVIMFTGGTTGKSKGAVLSHRAVMQGVVNGCYGYRGVFGQRYLLVLPLSHVFGLIRNLLTSFYTGSTIYICRNNKDMFRDIAVFKPTILVLVPALAAMALTLSKKFGRNMLGEDLKTIICGAAAVAPYLVTEYAKYGVTLCPGYGLTESANLVSGNPDPLKKPDSVGLPFPNQELKVVDGELWLKGRNMLTAYLGGVPAYEDGWFRTGDLVRFDEDGFLYITGRIKEIIVLDNGENVSPAEVEAHFNALTCVQDSQVFEDADEAGNHFLALEVVPRMEELGAVATEEIGAYVTEECQKVNRTLPAHWQVNRITVRETDFDRTPSMKIVRYHKCN